MFASCFISTQINNVDEIIEPIVPSETINSKSHVEDADAIFAPCDAALFDFLGRDVSVLLGDTATFTGEKNAYPNRNVSTARFLC